MKFDREYTHMDKSDWPDGPWRQEPDKAQWVDRETDLDCLIVRNRLGALCGYVGVPSDHPLHGKGDYNDDDYVALDVHGGITFAAACHEDGPVESSICHVPLPGRSDDIWWLGFDTAHSGDLVPGMYSSRLRALGVEMRNWETYKDVDYVVGECEALARQLAAAA